MEDSPYSALKTSLSSVSVKALNISSRQILANYLDCTQLFLSEKKVTRDYRGLAELIGLTYNDIKLIEESKCRTMKILESWETRPDATLDKLISFLEDMDRHDIIEDLIPLLEKNVKSYLEYQKSLEIPVQVPEVSSGVMSLPSKRCVVTRHDVINKECTIYDAYVSYAEEDSDIADEFANFLESPTIGLKLFIRGRDMLAGCPELDTDIELIKNRCRHMLILLTPNFLNSPALEFQVSFAGSLAIEQRQRILIPVILQTCEIPPLINTVSKIDFTKIYTKDWMMKKLISSLLHEDKVRHFLSSIERNPFASSTMIPYSASTMIPFSAYSVSEERVPIITFPPSAKHSLLMNNPSTNLAITKNDVSNTDNKDSDAGNLLKDPVVGTEINESIPSSSGSSTKFIRQFLSRLRKKRKTARDSIKSFSSGTTSGFYSQSCSSVDSLENLSDHNTNYTSL